MDTDIRTKMIDQRNYLIPALYAWIVDSGMSPYLMINLRTQGVVLPADQAISNGGKCRLGLLTSYISNVRFTSEHQITFYAKRDIDEHGCICVVPFTAIEWIYAKENGLGMMFGEKKNGAGTPFSQNKSNTVIIKNKPKPLGTKLHLVKG